MRAKRQARAIWRLVLLINGLLVFQYLLGMMINLFATIPLDTNDAPARSFLERTGLGFAYAREAAFLPLQLH